MLISSELPQITPDTPWQQCLADIESRVGPASFETWFRTTDLAHDGDRTLILVPNRFFGDFIEEHFGKMIAEVLQRQGIAHESIVFTPVEKDWVAMGPIAESIAAGKERSVPKKIGPTGRFHHNYTFDSFIVGDSNRMAHAASLAVAEAPGRTTFNPLIIYGGTGLGKTHLLQAIGHFAHTEGTADSVVYLTSEEFTSDYINFVVNLKDSTSFYRQFADVDLLLIDDIHFFSGKPGTQKEFFRIFNRLLIENKQIVLSSDRPPAMIPDMMDHIINRFMGGLVTDIQPPNLETRMAILRKKAETDGLSLPDNVSAFLAANITSNVRELEGILIKLIASAAFTGRDITLEVAREICGDLLLRLEEPLSIQHIQEKVAQCWQVSRNQLCAHTRRRDITLPRAVAMYLAKKLTRQSLGTIGLEFGGRDYSTVVHAIKRIESQMASDPALAQRVHELETVLSALG